MVNPTQTLASGRKFWQTDGVVLLIKGIFRIASTAVGGSKRARL
jgi:hypothetical protein